MYLCNISKHDSKIVDSNNNSVEQDNRDEQMEYECITIY